METDRLTRSLERQEELLKKLLAALDKPKLGFHDEAGTVYVYCNRQHNCSWYTLSGSDRTPQPIAHTALTGIIKDLRFEQTERRGKPCHKLMTTVQAGRTYVLESGYDTHFSKGLLGAIALMTPQQLLVPITIQPAPGDEDSVLFCRLWVGSELIKVSYDESVEWREIARAALNNVKLAREMPF